MPRRKNNGNQPPEKLVVLGPTDLPKSISLTWDYYKCTIDTDYVPTESSKSPCTAIDRVRSSAMFSHAKVAADLRVEFDPFNATITITKITLPLPPQHDDD
jgi:hypothetical protein